MADKSAPDPIAAMTREQLRALMKAHGGRFHGPNVEHVAMEEQAFWRFLDDVIRHARLGGVHLGVAAMRREAIAKCGNFSESAREDEMTGGHSKTIKRQLNAQADAADEIEEDIRLSTVADALYYYSYIGPMEHHAAAKEMLAVVAPDHHSLKAEAILD